MKICCCEKRDATAMAGPGARPKLPSWGSCGVLQRQPGENVAAAWRFPEITVMIHTYKRERDIYIIYHCNIYIYIYLLVIDCDE